MFNKILSFFWILAYRVELFLLVHPLNDTCTFQSSSAFSYILHMKRMKGKEYRLNIVIASVTNLDVSYLQLFLSTQTILNWFIHQLYQLL
jgi:hypothetical protein